MFFEHLIINRSHFLTTSCILNHTAAILELHCSQKCCNRRTEHSTCIHKVKRPIKEPQITQGRRKRTYRKLH